MTVQPEPGDLHGLPTDELAERAAAGDLQALYLFGARQLRWYFAAKRYAALVMPELLKEMESR